MASGRHDWFDALPTIGSGTLYADGDQYFFVTPSTQLVLGGTTLAYSTATRLGGLVFEHDVTLNTIRQGEQIFRPLQEGDQGWGATGAAAGYAAWYTDGSGRFVHLRDGATPSLSYYDVGFPLVSITWGDGTQSSADYDVHDLRRLFGDGDGVWKTARTHLSLSGVLLGRYYVDAPHGHGSSLDVVAEHTYAATGEFPIEVSIDGLQHGIHSYHRYLPGLGYGVTTWSNLLARVENGRLWASGVDAVGQEGAPFAGTLATFTDQNALDTATDYSAWIDWGDGNGSPGIVVGAAGSFSVLGAYAYRSFGNYTVLVSIRDKDGYEVTAFSRLNIENLPPTAVDDAYETSEDDNLIVDTATGVLANDTDPGNSPLTAALLTPPSHGALTLYADGSFTYAPEPGFPGVEYFVYRVADEGGAYADATVTITVTDSNHPPTATDLAVFGYEDTDLVLLLSDFDTGAQGTGYEDFDGDPLAFVRVISLPSAGGLWLIPDEDPAVPVAPGQAIAAGDLLSGRLRFVPAPHEHGSPYATFHFRVNDGELDSVDSYEMTIHVAPVNDPPTAENGSVTVAEDTPYAFQANDFGFSDIDGDALASVTITEGPALGTLCLDGEPVTAPLVVPAADLAAGRLVFVAASNAYGSPYAGFSFLVSDGQAVSAEAYTMTIIVEAVNDPPTAMDGSVTLAEDESYEFQWANFAAGYLDVEGAPLAAVRITNCRLSARCGSLQTRTSMCR